MKRKSKKKGKLWRPELIHLASDVPGERMGENCVEPQVIHEEELAPLEPATLPRQLPSISKTKILEDKQTPET